MIFARAKSLMNPVLAILEMTRSTLEHGSLSVQLASSCHDEVAAFAVPTTSAALRVSDFPLP